MKISFIILALIIISRNSNSQNENDSAFQLNSTENRINYWENYFNEKFISKGINTKGSGYKQFLMEKQFYEMNSSAISGQSEAKRWETYITKKLANLKKPEYQPASNWISMGPNSIDSFAGRMTSHAFDPSDPEMIWAGSSTGGIWRSLNGGNYWEAMTSELPSMTVSDLEINPNNRNIILCGTGNDRFLSITLGPGVGVLKSTDRGLTWNHTNFNYQLSQNVSVSKILWKPGSADSVYMAASNGIWLSTDSGDNWQQLLSGRASSILIDNNNTGNLYTVLRNNGVYKSTDGGTNWFLLTGGLPQGSTLGLTSISISRSNPQILFVSISDANTFGSIGLYKTTNAGLNWNQITNAPNVLCQPNAPTQCQGWFVNMVSISPFDPDLIFYGGVQFWRSSNGGVNWIQKDVFGGSGLNFTGRTYVDQWDIAYHPVNNDILYLFNDGGVQKSTDRGIWWNKCNNNLVTAQIHRISSSSTDTNLMIGGFQDHGLQKMNNSGGNTFWKRWSDNDGTNVIIDPADNNIFYGDFFLGTHKKSTNGGASWQSTFNIQSGITESGALIAPLVMHPDSSKILYTSSTAKIYKTTNGGVPWFPVADIPFVNTISIDKVNPSVIYAHAYSNTTWSVWKSVNYGSDWSQINSSTIPTWRVTDLETDPSRSGVVYATRNSSQLNQDHVKRSTDFGETWINISGDLPDIFVYAIAVSPVNSEHLYTATDLGVYATTNGGINWFEFNDGLPVVRTYDIHYHPLDRTIRIATIGRGVWKTKAIDAVTEIINEENVTAFSFKLNQNYPNPFNPETKIKYDLSKTGNVIITIYNSAGQKVNRLFEGIQNAGTYTVSWNARNQNGMELPSGIYFLKLTASGYSKTIIMNYIK